MARHKMLQSIQTADIIIISRTGQGIGYVIPVDLVLFLIWFLSSTTAQVLALTTLALVIRLRRAAKWWLDWQGWQNGYRQVMEDFGAIRKGFSYVATW